MRTPPSTTSIRRRRTWWAVLAAVAMATLVLGACSGDDDDSSSDTDNDTTSETTTPPGSTEPDATGDADGTPLGDGVPTPEGDGSGDTVVATTPIPDGDLPGTVFDLFPYEGAAMAVVGVTSDDVLNVRRLPDPGAPRVAALDPLSSGEAIATGRNRQLGSGEIWAEVVIGDSYGWANTRYLLQAGSVTDDTATTFGADRPTAGTMLELAGIVGDAYASTEPPSEIVIVSDPTDGDLSEVVIDVLGLGDDAAGGIRVHLFAERSGGQFQLRTVETTILCTRGVTDDGRCL